MLLGKGSMGILVGKLSWLNFLFFKTDGGMKVMSTVDLPKLNLNCDSKKKIVMQVVAVKAG